MVIFKLVNTVLKNREFVLYIIDLINIEQLDLHGNSITYFLRIINKYIIYLKCFFNCLMTLIFPLLKKKNIPTDIIPIK